ncbi:MAG TPA: hypothetical protein IGS37_06670 [Synechococcales cyanobacterium M55_K2018_004]|nr:hypothetical protein [Synechococcales cyanobacterium M55_K2018_004]
MRLGKVVKSNSHCDYVVQLDDQMAVADPPQADDFGFGSFVKLDAKDRHWAVGLIYNSLLVNPFLNNGPRLSSEPDPLFTPDLINETQTLLGVVLVGWLERQGEVVYGVQGIPRVVVPVNTEVSTMTPEEIYRFHVTAEGRSQFSYYSHLLRCGGSFAPQLTQQVLKEIIDANLFTGADQRALEILCRELSWKTTMSAMR